MSNPDLVERFKNNWPLEEMTAFPYWWNNSLGAKGYTDYPNYG
jgi:N-ethylmaleimide reductase